MDRNIIASLPQAHILFEEKSSPQLIDIHFSLPCCAEGDHIRKLWQIQSR